MGLLLARVTKECCGCCVPAVAFPALPRQIQKLRLHRNPLSQLILRQSRSKQGRPGRRAVTISAGSRDSPRQCAQPTVSPRGNLLVVIKAREDSWLSISVDGEIVTRALLTAPAQKSVRAEKEIVDQGRQYWRAGLRIQRSKDSHARRLRRSKNADVRCTRTRNISSADRTIYTITDAGR